MTNEEVIDCSLNHSQIRDLVTSSLQKDPSILCSGLVACLAKWSVYGVTDQRAVTKWMRLTPSIKKGEVVCPSCNGTGIYPGHSWECYRCHGLKMVSAFQWKGAVTA